MCLSVGQITYFTVLLVYFFVLKSMTPYIQGEHKVYEALYTG